MKTGRGWRNTIYHTTITHMFLGEPRSTNGEPIGPPWYVGCYASPHIGELLGSVGLVTFHPPSQRDHPVRSQDFTFNLDRQYPSLVLFPKRGQMAATLEPPCDALVSRDFQHSLEVDA